MSTNVSLTTELESYIQQKIATGFYASTSEVIRAGLRLLKSQDTLEEAKLQALKEEIQKGLQSGESIPYDLAAIKAEAKASFNQQ